MEPEIDLIAQLEGEIEDLRVRVAELNDYITNLLYEVDDYRDEANRWRQKYNDLSNNIHDVWLSA